MVDDQCESGIYNHAIAEGINPENMQELDPEEATPAEILDGSQDQPVELVTDGGRDYRDMARQYAIDSAMAYAAIGGIFGPELASESAGDGKFGLAAAALVGSAIAVAKAADGVNTYRDS